jgi:hypothetical protein
LLTEQKSEVSISDDISSVGDGINPEKDPGFMRSHRAHRSHRSQLTDNTLPENSFIPIVVVEDFFETDIDKEFSPLPDHSLEQSPCYPIIGSKSRDDHIIYHCRLHPKVKNTDLDSLERHCRFADPDQHKAEILRSIQEGHTYQENNTLDLQNQ